MPKKRGKSKSKVISKKQTKKAKALKKEIEKAPEAQKPVKDALHELEILAEEKKMGQKIGDIEKKETAIEKKEEAISVEEKKMEKETQKIEKLEKEIKEDIQQKPLEKLTIRDLNKGVVGAFIAVVAHFAFIYGKDIAKEITMARATVLIVFSYLLVILLMYETGYRKIKDKKVIGILPLRATAIFITSIVVILAIFFLFNQIDFSNLSSLYKQIAVTSVLASLGAGTADLIGRD